MVTQVEIARRVGLDVSSVNKILNRRQGPVFRKETIRLVFKTARAMGYDFGKLKFTHRRKYPRAEVSIGAEFLVYGKDGALYDQGVATVRDLSLGGARVSDVALPQGTFPTEPFTIVMRLMQKPLEDVEVTGRVVRLHQNGVLAFGIEFLKVDAGLQKRIRRVTG